MDKEITKLFEGVSEELLTEEVKSKIETLIEAKVSEKVNTKVQELEENFSSFKSEKVEELEEATVEYVDTYLVEKLDTFLDKVSDQWLEEHTVEVENGVKADLYEKLASGIKVTLQENQIKEADIETQTDLKESNDKIQSDYNKIFEDNAKLEKEIIGLKAISEFDTLTEDLSDSEKAKIAELSEDFDIDDLESFSSKIKTLVENVGNFEAEEEDGEEDEAKDDAETLEESTKEEDSIEASSEEIDQYGLEYV